MGKMKEAVNADLPTESRSESASESVSESHIETKEIKLNGSTKAGVDTEQTNNNNIIQEETETHKNIDELGGELELGDTALLDSTGRNELFQKGLLYEQNNQPELALKCYLGCLCGLKQDSNFSLLPQCLRNVADIYFKKEEYQRAVQFIQAEKLFYENALIDITELGKAEVGDVNGSNDQSDVQKVRAEEYEQLAKLCLERKQPHLALEYAGKATKIRQSIFGSNDVCTQESLDFFATVYAEVGKQQYSDSMGKISSGSETDADNVNTDDTPGGENGKQSGETTPLSILRNRKYRNRPRSAQHVRFVDGDGSSIDTQTDYTQQRELAASNRLLVILFVICTLLLSMLGVFLYCRLFLENSPACVFIKSHVHTYIMKIKYYYHYYFTSSKLLKYV